MTFEASIGTREISKVVERCRHSPFSTTLVVGGHRRDVREIWGPVNVSWLYCYARIVNELCTLCFIGIGCACRDCCRLNGAASRADGRLLLFHIFASGPGHTNGVTHVFGVILGVVGPYHKRYWGWYQ